VSRRAHILLLAVAAMACLSAPPLVLAGAHGPLRPVATLGLMSLAPGAALPRWRPPRHAALELALVIAVSLAACMLVAEAMLTVRAWAPGGAVLVVAGLSLPALLLRLYGMVGFRLRGLSEDRRTVSGQRTSTATHRKPSGS
jgi:hypothetical protein